MAGNKNIKDKDGELCRSCIFSFANCRAICGKCPQKTAQKDGRCKCLKVKVGEECPYYKRDGAYHG